MVKLFDCDRSVKIISKKERSLLQLLGSGAVRFKILTSSSKIVCLKVDTI
ncbi:hypothetical protein [Nostoc sp. DSM 114161]